MKRKTIFILCMTLLSVLIFTGCASKQEEPEEPQQEEETETKASEETEEPEETEEEKTALDSEALMDIAIEDAKADSVNCDNIKVALGLESDETATVTFGYKGMNYTYTIDKFSGEIVESKAEVGDSSQAVRMDVSDLFEIVFDASDYNASDMDDQHLDLKEDGDNAIVTFRVDGKEYKYVLNAYTGEIVESETP